MFFLTLVKFGFRQSCKMIPLYPIHHTTLPQPSQEWSAQHLTTVWLMCSSLRLHRQQEPVTQGGQAGTVMAAPAFATWYKHNITTTTQKFWISQCRSPSTQVSYKMVCSQAGNKWTSETSIFNSCISKSIISSS